MNPVAGGGRARRYWQRCGLKPGVDAEVVYTTARGEARTLAAAAGDRLVVAVGGDGTAHEVVNGLLSRARTQRPRLAVLQCGTGSDWQRTIPGPSRPEQVATFLRSDRWRPVDAGLLETTAGRRYFLNAADVGIGAAVVRRAERAPRAFGGTLNFLSAAIVSLLVHHNDAVRLSIDDGPLQRLRIRTIAVANGAYLGGGMRIAPEARPDDGLLDVCIVGDVSRLLGLRSLPLLYRGAHGRLQEVRFARARRVRVESDHPVGVEADGELAGETPATFQVVPHALDVLVLTP
ncbi:MAG TPA: diacylglycerol kinase family protein [Candidatus Limnocylindrales bacterium]|nr:diacylglycerol kinase family protein [Candidatus Limnocylindrales bacterium]